ncbi:PREDICTED: putative F-box protein At3g21130 [Camelina sativa]|uniref:F-box protein At3g21130 n=1 Tax=Camelina sativa TaxID=90675 RepID=A0ABM0WAZ3_CAMSA|nr:PREDICTED: putative F-box protein At3g21130 [Camelina sativa]
MMKKRNTVNHLPEDMVVEILSRVPAISLTRLRSTSKGWNALVKDDERLAKKHSVYAPKTSLVIMLIDYKLYIMNVSLHGIEEVDLSVKITCQFSLKDPNSSEEVDIRDVFHYDGLLLCSTKDNRLVVWNPCLGETRWIQPLDSYKESDFYALGYDHRSLCYKILRMQRHEDHIPVRTEYQVYDFTYKSWRFVGETEGWYIPSVGSRRRGLSVKGNTYWLATNEYGPPFDKFLICFDFSADRFRRLSLPTGIRSYYDVSLSVTREEQQLCMFSTYGSEVWIATQIDQSTGAVSWSKSHRFYLRIDVMTVLDDHEKNVFVYRYEARSKSVLHIVGEDIFIIQVVHHGADSKCPFFLTYVPTLVQIR